MLYSSIFHYNFHNNGRTKVMIASSRFVEAAQAQSAALGFTPATIFVPHPIQDRTDAEMRALADAAVAGIVAALVAQG